VIGAVPATLQRRRPPLGSISVTGKGVRVLTLRADERVPQ
jgi:hypothetical protein